MNFLLYFIFIFLFFFQIPKGALCLEKFEKLDHLGRFTLRDEERTIGFGKVMKIKPFTQ